MTDCSIEVRTGIVTYCQNNKELTMHGIQRNLVCIAVLLMALTVTGCLGKKLHNSFFEQRVAAITSIDDAIKLFGPPDADMIQADGLRRYSWINYKEHVIPAHEVILYRTPFWRMPSVMDDYYDVVRIPDQISRAYCYFNIFTNNGDIEKITWEGNYCDTLLKRNLGDRKWNSLPDKPLDIQENRGVSTDNVSLGSKVKKF